MAAVLSNNMSDEASFLFYGGVQANGIASIGSWCKWVFYKFTVNDDYAVRFGMGAIKVGSGAVATIVENRKDAKYKSILT
jgi:DNA polymerase-3 subunit alpha